MRRRRRDMARAVLAGWNTMRAWPLPRLQACAQSDQEPAYRVLAARAILEAAEPGRRGREALHALLTRLLGHPTAHRQVEVSATSRVIVVPVDAWPQIQAMYAARLPPGQEGFRAASTMELADRDRQPAALPQPAAACLPPASATRPTAPPDLTG